MQALSHVLKAVEEIPVAAPMMAAKAMLQAATPSTA
jgi:hypothetical protein